MTTTDQIKELKRQIKNTHARFVYAGKKPRRNPVYEGAAIGLRGDCQEDGNRFAIRQQSPTITDMSTPPALSRAYGTSRQRTAQLVAQYGIEIMSDPDRLFETLLLGVATKLRAMLADPARRVEIHRLLRTQNEIPKLRAIVAEHRAAVEAQRTAIREARATIAEHRAVIRTTFNGIRKLTASIK